MKFNFDDAGARGGRNIAKALKRDEELVSVRCCVCRVEFTQVRTGSAGGNLKAWCGECWEKRGSGGK